MAEKTVDSDVLAQLDSEHRQLSKAIQELQALVRSPVTEKTLAGWKKNTEASLEVFQGLVRGHFEHEEEGGFLRDVLREVPNSQREVRALRREHRDIERRLTKIRKKLSKLDDSGAAERISRRIAEMTRLLVNHETTEQHLVQRTYYREYGVGD